MPKPKQGPSERTKIAHATDTLKAVAVPELPDKTADRKAVFLHIREAEENDTKADRRSKIEALLVEHNFLGLDPSNSEQISRAVDTLVALETMRRMVDPKFEIGSAPVNELRRSIGTVAEEAKKTDSKDLYKDFLQHHQDKPAIVVMEMALAAGVVPPEEIPKLRTYLRIRDLAQTPEDKAVIEGRINTYEFTDLPDPMIFIQEEIFESPLISQATQEAIAREFKVTPKRNVTGSDVLRNAGETQINPKTGEAEYIYSRENPMVYRDGLEAFVEETGRRTIRGVTEDGRVREIDVTGWSGEDVGTLSEYMQFWRTTEDAGITHFMETLYFPGQALNDTVTPDKLRYFRQVINTLRGGTEGYDGAIFGRETTNFLTWQLQFFSPKAGAAQGDFDIAAAEKNFRLLGAKDKSGRLNLEVLTAIGDYSRAIYLRGAPSFDLLQEYLAAVFPNQDQEGKPEAA